MLKWRSNRKKLLNATTKVSKSAQKMGVCNLKRGRNENGRVSHRVKGEMSLSNKTISCVNSTRHRFHYEIDAPKVVPTSQSCICLSSEINSQFEVCVNILLNSHLTRIPEVFFVCTFHQRKAAVIWVPLTVDTTVRHRNTEHHPARWRRKYIMQSSRLVAA